MIRAIFVSLFSMVLVIVMITTLQISNTESHYLGSLVVADNESVQSVIKMIKDNKQPLNPIDDSLGYEVKKTDNGTYCIDYFFFSQNDSLPLTKVK